MKLSVQVFIFVINFLTIGWPHTTHGAVHSERFMHSGYLQVGAGTNLLGRDQVCFSQPGAVAQKLRLGNACRIYGELAFTAHHLTLTNEGPYFLSRVGLAFSPAGDALFEPAGQADGVQVIEAYAEGGRLFEKLPWGFWVGKRLYRDLYSHLFDWYYFAQARGGNGAGITGIDPGSGRIEVALLFQVGQEEGYVGQRLLQWLDLRWFDIELSDSDSLNLWGAIGASSGGVRTELADDEFDSDGNPIVRTINLEPGLGWLLAGRYRRSFVRGFNDFMLATGSGLLHQFSLYGEPGRLGAEADLRDASSLRIVEHLSHQLSQNWAYLFGAAYEYRYDGNYDEQVETWLSAGLRPIYFVNDHFQIATEIGHSVVRLAGERQPRTLTRLTFAPQLAASRDQWGKPVLRAFYSYSTWNTSNMGEVGGEAYANKTSGHNLGVETELWF